LLVFSSPELLNFAAFITFNLVFPYNFKTVSLEWASTVWIAQRVFETVADTGKFYVWYRLYLSFQETTLSELMKTM